MKKEEEGKDITPCLFGYLGREISELLYFYHDIVSFIFKLRVYRSQRREHTE